MRRRIVKLALIFSCAGPIAMHAQEFKVFDRTVQIHGCASQGFVYTDQNNWLTMHSAKAAARSRTSEPTSRRRLPTRFASGRRFTIATSATWESGIPPSTGRSRTTGSNPRFGIRGGKEKTVVGLYNDTQDLDFVHTFALLPQGVYLTDPRGTA